MKQFNGTGILVWMADARLKYKAIHDQSKFKEELSKLLEKVSPTCVSAFAINWDQQEILFIKGEDEVNFSVEQC